MTSDANLRSVEDELANINFHHPFTPYDVQEQFMKTVYRVLEAGHGQVGILESPTGTGKSLSLICASLTWLRNHKSSAYQTALEEAKSSFEEEPEWMVDQLLRRKREELVRSWEDREKRLEQARLKEKAREERVRKKRRFENSLATREAKDDDDGEEWMLDEWEGESGHVSAPKDALSGLSKESRDVLERMGLGTPKQKKDDGETPEDEIKIYYASRTHSQLSQFITELRRPSFPPSLPKALSSGGPQTQAEIVKLLPLSSRQKLCINPGVSQLKSVQAINDRCAELQQPKSGRKCQFVPREELLQQTHEFRDTALATIPDIEDLHQLGKTLQVCPYYASRTALPGAEIVTLPYPLLLQKSARDALGIKLEGNVVIVDEAHNIMNAVSNVYATDLRLSDLRRCREMLGVYVRRFGKRLKGVNRVNVGRVGRVVEGLSEYMNSTLNAKDHGIVDPNELTRPKGIDQINMFELTQYIHESKLAYKIEGYASLADSQQQDGKQPAPKSSSPVLHTFVSFLVALTNLSSEGRIFYQKLTGSPADVQLSYLLLSPTHAFSSIISSARAVILAGGTMSPFEDYKDHLFPTLEESKVTTLSCGHVIPATNLCVRTLATSRVGGPSFEFSFQRRGDHEMVSQLGLSILNMCSVVPDGVVVFFPSYGYLDKVVEVWKKKGKADAQSTWERLKTKKEIFQEIKGASSDEVLQKYSEAILGVTNAAGSKGGALLLSVVGGKMSEGINFSDRLGRLVVVVGLPYPNIASPDWKAKMEYIESSTRSRLVERGGISAAEATTRAKQTARDFYENSCMRAVNQSIGRAIRHRGDYAAIVLLDTRYNSARIRNKLPGWIQGGLQTDAQERGLGGLMAALASFFRGKRSP